MVTKQRRNYPIPFHKFATAALAYPHAQRSKGIEWSRRAQIGAFVLNITIQLANSGVNVVASWFGPVSIVLPTIVSAQLLFNMIMFGVLIRLEKFSKETRVGTYLLVLATVLLPIVGPSAQQEQDIVKLLLQPVAAAWTALLFAGILVSAIGLPIVNRMNGEGTAAKKSRLYFLLNIVAQTTAGVLGVTLSKAFVLVDGLALVITIILWAVTGLVHMYAVVLQATTVSQAKFVPSLVAANISINAIT